MVAPESPVATARSRVGLSHVLIILTLFRRAIAIYIFTSECNMTGQDIELKSPSPSKTTFGRKD